MNDVVSVRLRVCGEVVVDDVFVNEVVGYVGFGWRRVVRVGKVWTGKAELYTRRTGATGRHGRCHWGEAQLR